MKPWLRLVLLVPLLTVTSSSPSHAAVCTVYPNSKAMPYPGHGYVCMGSGSGCQECINQDGGGAMVCIQDISIKICIDYQW